MNADPLRKKYARIAGWYDLLDFPWEMLRYRKVRPEVWRRTSGARLILDAGAGTGRNIPYYPPSAHVTGVDLSEAMLVRARRRAATSSAVRLSCGTVLALPFKSRTFDAVVSTFLFCVLPDDLQPPALKELSRVLKPGGRAILLEYQYSRHPWRRAVMKAMSPWVAWAYGARFDRRTPEHLASGGWRILEDRFVSGDTAKVIVAEPGPLGDGRRIQPGVSSGIEHEGGR